MQQMLCHAIAYECGTQDVLCPGQPIAEVCRDLMKFDDQNGESGIEALTGYDRLKARLLRTITGLDVKFHEEVRGRTASFLLSLSQLKHALGKERTMHDTSITKVNSHYSPKGEMGQKYL